MSDESVRRTVNATRWAFALSIGAQAALSLLHSHGHPEIVVGVAEIVAVSLFAIPMTSRAGAVALIAIFAFAAAVHRGQLAVWLIYPTLLVVLISTISTADAKRAT